MLLEIPSPPIRLRGYVQPLTVACQLLTTYETEPVPEQTYANVCRVVCNLLARPSLSPPFSFPLFPSRFAHTCDAFPCQGDRGAGSAADFPFLAERRVGRSNQLAEVSRNCRDRFCGGKDAFKWTKRVRNGFGPGGRKEEGKGLGGKIVAKDGNRIGRATGEDGVRLRWRMECGCARLGDAHSIIKRIGK